MTVMTLKDQLIVWQEAVTLFDHSNYKLSLSHHKSFSDCSKHFYNIGIISHKLLLHKQAIDSLDKAIHLDPHFAVAYLQRGYLLYYCNDLEGALQNFQDCYTHLRRNEYIDYTQIGLDYRLHQSLVICNIALCYLLLGNEFRGLKYLDSAADLASQSTIKIDDSKNIQLAKILGVLSIKTIYPTAPLGILFRPQADNIKNAERIDHLGKSKIVAHSDKDDLFNGFSGRLQKELTLGRKGIKILSTTCIDTTKNFVNFNDNHSFKLPASLYTHEEVLSTSNLSIRSSSNSNPSNNSLRATSLNSSCNVSIFSKKLPALPSPPTSPTVFSKLKCKIFFKDCRIIVTPLDIKYAEFIDKVRLKFKDSDMGVKYRGVGGTEIIILNDDDLVHAFEQSRNNRLELWGFHCH